MKFKSLQPRGGGAYIRNVKITLRTKLKDLKVIFELVDIKLVRVFYCCFKFQEICSKYGAFRDVLNGLDSSTFAEILNSDTTADILFIYHEFKITFKH